MKTIEMFKKFNLVFLALMILALVSGCKKDEEATPQSNGSEELSFTIKPGKSVTGLKESDCFSEKASYVRATILKAGNALADEYKINVFYIGETPYTNTIKLAPGTYTLQEFILYNDNMTPNDPTDDWEMAAAPHTGSLYASLVGSTLTQNFIIEAFKKNVMTVELVCYDEAHYSNFGFEYFKLDQTVLREQYFFGDFCIKSIAEYTGSLYAQQSNGVQLDMPAIFKIEVYQNGVLKATYDNAAWLGEGQPLKVVYADNLNTVDQFVLKLYILVRQGTQFNYVYFHDFTFSDDQKIAAGTDGVVDFALGNCVPDADLIIAPWMNLPPTATYKIVGQTAPGSKGGYVDAQLTNIPAGYEIENSTVASWCGDHQVVINTGQSYNMDVYSSLYPTLLPTFAKTDKWAQINWIMNHLDWYPGHAWDDLQGAIWLFDTPAWNGVARSGVRNLSQLQWAQKMHDDAVLYGDDYRVPPGGWACVIFVPVGTAPNAPTPSIQTMFIKVDP